MFQRLKNLINISNICRTHKVLDIMSYGFKLNIQISHIMALT